MIDGSSENIITAMAEYEQAVARQMTASIIIFGGHHNSLAPDTEISSKNRYMKLWHKPVYFDTIVAKTKWVLLSFPTPAKAEEFGMTLEEFTEFYFRTMLIDYARMAQAARPLKELMKRTNVVRIKGPGETDLTFSIKGIPTVVLCGEINLPDGENRTAPVRESTQGIIHFNTPSIYNGEKFRNIRLKFKDGKIIDADAREKTANLNLILDTDEGARYCGEFAIGFHPCITAAVGNIPFDEKTAGSLHLAPGDDYDDAPNGNKSGVHWDMVLIQTSEYGGGEMWFDGVLVRKNGLFVLPELERLNPENLLKS